MTNGPQFHETGYGRTFFQGQLPNLIHALQKMGDQLQDLNKNLERILTVSSEYESARIERSKK